MHKALFPMLPQDLESLLAIFAIAFLAGAPGIGGGGINVPILMMLARFDIKEAVPLSHIAVMGNTLAQMIFNLRLVHPSCPTRPLVHFEAAALIMPAMLGGNSLGVVVGHVFPPTALIVISLALLTLTSVKTTLKGCQHRRMTLAAGVSARSSLSLTQRPASDGAAALELPGNSSSLERMGAEPLGPSGLPGDCPRGLLADDGKVRYPWNVIGFMVAFIAVFCLDFVLLAQDVSGIQSCTPVYWVVLLGIYPFIAIAVIFGIRFLKELARWHEERGHGTIQGDLQVNTLSVTILPCVACLIGLFAGLLGLGGGEFTVPLLLEFGFQARVAAATSGFLTFLNTFSNIAHYIIAGTMEPFLGHGVALFAVAMLGSFTGLIVGNTQYIRERSYLIIFLVAFLLAFSGVLLAMRGLTPQRINWTFQPFAADDRRPAATAPLSRGRRQLQARVCSMQLRPSLDRDLVNDRSR
eukprot:CAMPEP_0204564888 /NCGR_PEP_ID=MMETSP0661-20131031/35154_1 /ASSEMBLY_ACC=CAM_ASM_000606 /TAXON_ID=109239 /ORGANISM="Alexandrium margalefi, Strain AMGDE01CS-322" /LENGTH=466 /DNA_ID=CAMNT_0051572579 /DNA_START=233 /DNA_END=1631 /DNA_ORIENTATION=-